MKEIKIKNMVACPKCGKEATICSTSNSMFIWMIVSLLCFGVSVWIPVLGWICTPIFIIMAIIFFIAAIIGLFTGGAKIECKKCNSKYKLTKEEYKEYMGKKGPSFAEQAKESWNESKNSNAHIFINKIEKLENKIENTTDEKKIAKMQKEIKRLEKHI